MAHLVISSSLNPKSRSRLLARSAYKALEQMEATVKWIDLADYSIPFCDGSSAHENSQVKKLRKKIHDAEGILLAVPIYNYYANAAIKNLIELTGEAWSKKVVGFLCAAGGRGSYMSVMNLANSLMLDFRCFIIPRFVYSTEEAFEKEKISDPEVKDRINELVQELHRTYAALNK